MDAILENETLNKVMNFILDNIWIIGLSLAIIVVIILIIIFSKKRPVEINDNNNGNVGDLITVNHNLENNMLTSEDLVDQNINDGNNLVNLRGANDPQIVSENLSGPEPVEILANTGNELSITPDTTDDFKANQNETLVEDPIETLNTLPQNEVSGMEKVDDISAFDMPAPNTNQTSTIENIFSENKDISAQVPEVTDLEDTLELPKMANATPESVNQILTKKCQSCGHINNAAYKVCVKCGNILE